MRRILPVLLVLSACGGNPIELDKTGPDAWKQHVAETRSDSLKKFGLGGAVIVEELLVEEPPDINVIREQAKMEGVAPDKVAPPENELLLADFDKDGLTIREWNCPAGGWISDPTDPTIKCIEAYDPLTRIGDKGFALKLWYDFESPNSSFGGLWLQFKNRDIVTLDLTEYRALQFYAKGSQGSGFTTRLRMELKNKAEVGKVTVHGISAKWQKFVIDLDQFKGITDWTTAKELTIVLERDFIDRREGIIYFDDVSFVK